MADHAPAPKPTRRYVRFRDRAHASLLADAPRLVDGVQRAKTPAAGYPGARWRGVPRHKSPWDVVLLEMLVWELRPGLIIEVGSAEGGSALWLGALLEAFGVDGHVRSFDVRAERAAPGNERVSFHHADARDLAATLDHGLLDGPRPWLVLEDSHVATTAVLEHFHPLLRPGDHVVVEDTGALAKHRDLARFLEGHDEYRVDTAYCDNFGYNVTWNWNGWLRRME